MGTQTLRAEQHRLLTYYWQQALGLGMPDHGILLIAETYSQRLHMLDAGSLTYSYPISTSRFGLGNEKDSFRTPPGFHEVTQRYGDNEPPGRVFCNRSPTEQVIPEEAWRSSGNEDHILSRILRLAGKEYGINLGPGVDTYPRMIYLHGTNQEQLIGTAASKGCIRLRNKDIIELFSRIKPRPVYCWIGHLHTLFDLENTVQNVSKATVRNTPSSLL